MQLQTLLPKQTNYQRTAIEIICYAFVVLFLYAAFYKLLDYNYFVRQLGKSDILAAYKNTVAWLVPAIEIIIAVMLIFTRSRLAGLYGSTALMAAFSIYIFYVLNYSPHVPCACGGILAVMGWRDHLVFNICFTLLGIVGIVLIKNKNITKIFPWPRGQGKPKTWNRVGRSSKNL